MSGQVPVTGDAAVDAALVELENIEELSTGEKLERFSRAQRALAEELEDTHSEGATS
ncbi:MAG: hypothetical protein LBC29_00815 [Propionibacteriaceae bacterium]|nr:hypothetical protein [Propionibacteriaceae bacterium]